MEEDLLSPVGGEESGLTDGALFVSQLLLLDQEELFCPVKLQMCIFTY